MQPQRRNHCEDCLFWDQEGAPKKDTGYCRAEPPRAMALLVPVQNVMRAQQELQTQTHTCWPITHAKVWCGRLEVKNRVQLN